MGIDLWTCAECGVPMMGQGEPCICGGHFCYNCAEKYKKEYGITDDDQMKGCYECDPEDIYEKKRKVEKDKYKKKKALEKKELIKKYKKELILKEARKIILYVINNID